MFDSVRGHVGMALVGNEHYVPVLKITTAYATIETNDHNACCSDKLQIIFFFSVYMLDLIHGSLDAMKNSYSTSFLCVSNITTKENVL